MEKLAFCEKIYSSNSVAAIQRLSVLNTTDSLCLFMYDNIGQLLEIQEAINIDLSQKKVIFQHLSKNDPIPTIEVYYSTMKFSLMPRKLFLYGKEKSYLSNICKISSTEVIFTDQCDAEQIINIYAIPVQEDFAIRQAINGVRTKHLISEFIRSTKLLNQKAYFYILHNTLHIFYNKDNTPQLVSIFPWQSWEDILYKIQEINNHFSLNDNEIILCGDIDKNDSKFLNLRNKKPSIGLFSELREINLSFILNP